MKGASMAQINVSSVNGGAPSGTSGSPTLCGTTFTVSGTYSAKEESLTVKCFLTYPGQSGKNTSAQTTPTGGAWSVTFSGVGATAPDLYTQLDAKLYSGTSEIAPDGPYYVNISS
jgi:hypothetical protein